MSKLAWDDSHKYSVELTAREMRVIGACLDLGAATLDGSPIKWSKVHMETLRKLCDEFYNYGNKYFCFGLYPDKIGRRAKRVKPTIDKP